MRCREQQIASLFWREGDLLPGLNPTRLVTDAHPRTLAFAWGAWGPWARRLAH